MIKMRVIFKHENKSYPKTKKAVIQNVSINNWETAVSDKTNKNIKEHCGLDQSSWIGVWRILPLINFMQNCREGYSQNNIWKNEEIRCAKVGKKEIRFEEGRIICSGQMQMSKWQGRTESH